MEQQEYESPSADLEPEEQKSAFDRFAEVFTSPRSAFTGLISAPKGPIITWGLVITGLIALFTVVITTSNPELYKKGVEKRRQAIERAHDSGKMKDNVYEQQIEGLDKMGGRTGMVIGGISALIFAPIVMLILSVLVLIVLKVLQRDSADPITFSTALSLLLISSMISFVGAIIGAVLKLVTVNPAADLSPAYFVDTESLIVMFLLGVLNPFTLWWFYAIGTGISTVARAPLGKSIVVWAGVWILGGLVLFGALEGVRGLFGF
jgi:hypothetical protein